MSTREEVKEYDFLTSTQNIVQQALSALGYKDETYDLLKEPIRVLTVRFPVRMDYGKIKIFTGYRAQHNDAIGLTKGGIRIHPDISAEDVKALSIWMTLKWGIAGVPYGGGKGGIVCDPRHMSSGEMERLCRGYVRAISQMTGPSKDILASDGCTNSQIMAWIMDEYSHLREFEAPHFITGKPLVLGGSQSRESAAALSTVICVEEAAKKIERKIKDARVIVQGFGHTGSFLAKMLKDRGATIVGISDAIGGLYDKDGLDIESLLEKRDSFGTVTNLFRNTITNKDLLESDCDVLVPASVSNQVTKDNAHQVKASLVVEAANNPITMEAVKILHDRGVLVVPEVLASSGESAVSYFESVRNNLGYYWTEEEAAEKIRDKVVTGFQSVIQTSTRYKVDTRLAACIVGVRKTAEASIFRGWF